MGLVTLTNYTDGATITAAGQNSNENAIANEFNGNIENVNIKASAAIVDTKLAQITTANKVHGTAITGLASLPAGAGVIPTANIPSLLSHGRVDMFCTQATSTTISVGVGQVDINGTVVSKTTATTLTLTTAGNWAGGSSLQAVSTHGYIGCDISGNLKMHTTAPSHSDYGVSNTAGVKRYVTWSGTVYRVVGWFYMNATGSGELNSYEVGNLRDGDVYNATENSSTSDLTVNDTSYGTDMDLTTIHIYTTGRPVTMDFNGAVDECDAGKSNFIFDVDGTDKTNAATLILYNSSGGAKLSPALATWQERISQGAHTIKVQGQVTTSQLVVTNWIVKIAEL